MNIHKKPPRPIDRGWAWFIMIGTYVIMLIPFGYSRSLSVFLPYILDRYNKPAAVTTLAFGVGDIAWSLTNIAIPSLLLPRFSVRTLAVCAAFCHCFAVIGVAYSPNIIMFNCLYAVFGSADSLMIVTSLIHLGHYFKKRLSFASAVAQIGSSTATVLAPRLALFLKDTYGYQGALLIIGGISFHCVAAAMLLWPVSMFGEPDYSKEGSDNSSKSDIQAQNDTDRTDMAIKTNIQEEEDEEEINEKSKFVQVIDLKDKQINEQLQTTNLEHVINNEIVSRSDNTSTNRSSQSNNGESRMLSPYLLDFAIKPNISNQNDTYSQIGHPVYYTNDVSVSVLSTANKETQKNNATHDPVDEYVRRSSSTENVSKPTALIHDESNSNQESTPPVTSERCCSLQKIKAYLFSSVLLNPVAVMLVVAAGLSTPAGNMYLPVLGLENGLSPDEVPWILTIMGISDIFGKLAIGFFADLGYVRPIRIASITQFTMGMVCQFTTFYKGFGPMSGMAVLLGTMNGVVQSLMPSMVVELLGLPYLAQVTPICYLLTGVSSFALNVAVGAIKDATRTFSGGFNFLGGMLLTSSITLLLEPTFVKCRDKFSKHTKNMQ
ncbi:hypothetical protein BsWGS_23281 [Bradybaena similaris]